MNLTSLAVRLAQAEGDGTAEEVRQEAEQVAAQLPGYAFVLIKMGAILAGAFLLNRIMRRMIRRFLQARGAEGIEVSRAVEEKRAQTMMAVLRAAVGFAIWAVAIFLALDQIPGLDLGPLIAAAGIGGVAIGFGAQHLVRDVIAGFFILFEDQFHVSDVVSVGGVSGVVEKITLRATVLRDLEGRVHVVPNGEIRVSTNFTKGFSRYLIDLPVPYGEDVDRVLSIVREAADELAHEPEYSGSILGPLEVLGVDAYGDSQIVVKVYVDTIPGKQWEVGRELRARIIRAYDRHGISVPYPHREIIVREAPSSGSGDGEAHSAGESARGTDREGR